MHIRTKKFSVERPKKSSRPLAETPFAPVDLKVNCLGIKQILNFSFFFLAYVVCDYFMGCALLELFEADEPNRLR